MEKHNNVYFMSAVGFKPPHKGHLKMIEAAVTEAASKGANYKLFIGQSERGGITLDQSLEMLEIFLNDAGILSGEGVGRVDVIPVRGNTDIPYADNKKNRDSGRAGKPRPLNPMDVMMQMALDHDAVPENSVIVNPTSKKDEGRPDVFKGRIAKQRPDIAVVGLEVAVEPVTSAGAELSATGMREAINNNNFEEYKEYIPERSLNKAEYIWERILGRELPVNNLDATELNEMILECLKDSVESLLKENNDDSHTPAERAIMERAKYLLDSDEKYDRNNPEDRRRAWSDAKRHVKMMGLKEEPLEEESSMGNGAVQGSMRAPAKRDEEDTLIREVYNY